jgi:DNA polymerase III alpha subunit
VLGITSIDPVRQGLLFERFVSEERREPPDIDVDFEHERREEVIQWIYETYGRTRSALTCTVTRYRARGAVREVGKALGVPEDITAALAKLTWAIKSLRNDQLPLFDQADRREATIKPEIVEQGVELPPMTGCREVVEDYRSHGLTLRAHPLAFLREELAKREILPCSAIKSAKDRSRISISGLILVRQKPGSAKDVMFITLEDKTDIFHLIVWPSVFDKLRRAIWAPS